jgi:hypothetical protein
MPLAEFFIFQTGVFMGLGLRDMDRMRQDFTVGEFQEIIELGNPVPHRHGPAVQGLQLGKFQIGGDNAVESLKLGFVQVVFGDFRIFQPDTPACITCQPHIGG